MTYCTFRWLVSLLALLVSLSSARAQGEGATPEQHATPEQIEFFERRIRPLLAAHCYECHSHKADKVKGELHLDTRAGVRQGGESGPAIVPGKPDESLLIKAVRYTDKDFKMPPKAKLSQAEIDDLVTWVKMGAPDPREGKVASAPAKLPTIDLEQGKKFWSFQAVRGHEPPAVKDAAWPISPIDHFILAKLESKGLRPAAKADRRTLLRRATFDLTGLPPTPEEMAAFLADDSPRAFAKVVERLLASPAYGERWGRHWLDVVRYADTAGDNSDYPIPQMYQYRNWVLEAFQRDMPYDRFIREQIAGDLMPAASEAERRARVIATGYLANSRRHGSYEDARYPWHLTIEDTIDNLGKAFLGVSINCCRCHDHKFDPLSAEDYYALYGFFSSTRYPWPGIELDRVPRDLVYLGPADAVERETKVRQAMLLKMDQEIKKLETDKAALEKELRSIGKNPADEKPPDPAELKKRVDEATKAVQAAKKDREKFAQRPLPLATAYAVIDGKNEPKKRIGQVGNARLMVKGDPDRLGKEVTRRFPAVLGGQTLPAGANGSGRVELADWIADAANPLTARVMVNRIWQYHFGRGIVATPNDFGKQGRPPSHPELLDYLARHFVQSGWSIKEMHRLVMLSATYQQSSWSAEREAQGAAPEGAPRSALRAPHLVDPDNEYLWHFSRRRLDAESIRDAILAVSGSLDRSVGGPHPFPEQTTWDFTQHKPFKAVYESRRRSVYLMTQRIQRHPYLALFDGPDTNASTDRRTTSTTPLQALFLMNDPFVHEQARRFGERLLAEGRDDAGRLERAFLLAFGRPPTSLEREQATHYLAHVGDRLRGDRVPAEQLPARTWESLARVLFMSSEFVYVN